MNASNLQTNIEALRKFAQSKGWSIVEEKEIQFGYQLTVSDGKNKIPMALFTTGKVLIQGKPSELQTELKSWWYGETLPFDKPAASTSTQPTLDKMQPVSTSIPTTTNITGLARIGLDESGKGDYFGPLVIGAVYIDAKTETLLANMGVRDSKLLTDNRMLAMAEEIKAICPNFVLPIDPKRYNALYAQIQNLNRLLAWGHAWSLENMLEKVSCNLAIVDQFGDKSYVQNALREKGRSIMLEQRIHAEEDIAVAAASILARTKFVQRMEQLANRVDRPLPKGASDPAIVMVGREIVAKYGKDMLAEVAKLHFKTTEAILS